MIAEIFGKKLKKKTGARGHGGTVEGYFLEGEWGFWANDKFVKVK